ncbi:MAG: hypothetical protein WDN44_15780 [Sphingomonas sp.]
MANDWRDLIGRSGAFDPVEIQRGYMPRATPVACSAAAAQASDLPEAPGRGDG